MSSIEQDNESSDDETVRSQPQPQQKGFQTADDGGGTFEGDFNTPERKSMIYRHTKWSYKFVDYQRGGVGVGKDIEGRKKGPRQTDNWAQNLAKGGWHAIPFFGPGKTFWGRNLWDWLKKPKYHFCDLVDRLNCSFSPALLLFFVVLVSANIYGVIHDSPIDCLPTSDLTTVEYNYALKICQTKNFYSAIPDEGIPWDKAERRRREIGYYHWVPLTLILQAILFYLPNWIWVRLNRRGTGVDYASIMRDACALKEGKETEIRQKFNRLADKIQSSAMNRLTRRLRHFRFGEAFGGGVFFTILYIGIKCLYLFNVAGQFFLLNFFLGSGYRLWGYEVLRALMNEQKWQGSKLFPQLALCDVPIHRLGDTPRYTLQCHLVINTYNEKIYLFIWCYFLAIALATALNILCYLTLFIPSMRLNIIRAFLYPLSEFGDVMMSREKKNIRLVKSFIREGLNYDGVLLFMFIADHAGQEVASHLLGLLFETFLVDNKVIEDDYAKSVRAKENRDRPAPAKSNNASNQRQTYKPSPTMFGECSHSAGVCETPIKVDKGIGTETTIVYPNAPIMELELNLADSRIDNGFELNRFSNPFSTVQNNNNIFNNAGRFVFDIEEGYIEATTSSCNNDVRNLHEEEPEKNKSPVSRLPFIGSLTKMFVPAPFNFFFLSRPKDNKSSGREGR